MCIIVKVDSYEVLQPDISSKLLQHFVQPILPIYKELLLESLRPLGI